MTGPVSIRIDEVVLDSVDAGGSTAEVVQAEVARALARQPVERAERVAAEVGRAVERSTRAC